MKTIGSPTELCDIISNTTDKSLEYTTDESTVTPFEDIETALSLLESESTHVDTFSGFTWSVAPGPVMFETQDSGEPVTYIFDKGKLYRSNQ